MLIAESVDVMNVNDYGKPKAIKEQIRLNMRAEYGNDLIDELKKICSEQLQLDYEDMQDLQEASPTLKSLRRWIGSKRQSRTEKILTTTMANSL